MIPNFELETLLFDLLQKLALMKHSMDNTARSGNSDLNSGEAHVYDLRPKVYHVTHCTRTATSLQPLAIGGIAIATPIL